MTYTSYIWNDEGECINNATDVSIPAGDVMGNEDICEMIITIESDEEETECMYFETMATRDSNRNYEYWALIGLLIFNYVWSKFNNQLLLILLFDQFLIL